MALKSILLSLIAPGAVLVAAPAMAQAPAPTDNLPTCSATVTDHCVHRGGSTRHAMGHHAQRHHHMARHHHKTKRHHKARHHATAHHMAAKPKG